MDNKSYTQILMDSDSLRKPILDELIKALHLPSNSRGIDVGCGAGLQCLLLAEATGPAGHVTGLDISMEMLDYGQEIVRTAGLAEQISFQEGDIADLPFDDNTFDYAWSADCVGYEPSQPVSLVKEMMRVVKPGGTIAITAWSSEKLLPGYPRLEARLGATAGGLAPFIHGADPKFHFMRAGTLIPLHKGRDKPAGEIVNAKFDRTGVRKCVIECCGRIERIRVVRQAESVR